MRQYKQLQVAEQLTYQPAVGQKTQKLIFTNYLVLLITTRREKVGHFGNIHFLHRVTEH